MSKTTLFPKYHWRYWYHEFEAFLYKNSKQSDNAIKLLENLHHGPLLLVCNGPSLNHTPLDKFKNIQSIGLNKIHLIFDKTIWRPSLILCMNRYVVSNWQDNFLDSPIPTGLAWHTRHNVKKENRDKFAYFLLQNKGYFGKDITGGLDAGATVTYAALQFAFFAKANPVIIVGLDHKFNAPGSANKLVTSQSADVNHFDPQYFGPGIKWNLPDLKASEKNFTVAKQAFEADNRKIYDATIDGNLKVFDKISLDEALLLCDE